MELKNSYKKGLAAAACALVVLFLVGVYSVYVPPTSKTFLPTTTVTIGKTHIEAELAVTQVQREQGLSGRTYLSAGKGMLFVFDAPDTWGIWMKDMHFPIDIVWADTNGMIITIEHNVAPSSYPAHSFYPSNPAEYVLELPAGYTKAQSIAVGQKIVI